MKICWNHTLDEWEGLHVDETLFLETVVGVETIMCLSLSLNKLYSHTVQSYIRSSIVRGLWTGHELEGLYLKGWVYAFIMCTFCQDGSIHTSNQTVLEDKIQNIIWKT